ncbi:MAG: hypothetical protein IT184_11790 [Acidobacteria bacterium]|nr:hypothetical protein [Acidobacteriota bacterium]
MADATTSRLRLPGWAPRAALAIALLLAWGNFLFTSKWAYIEGSLHGWRRPWYAAALVAATILAIRQRARVGSPVVGRWPLPGVFAVVGFTSLCVMFFSRLPIASWGLVPFADDWTVLFQEAVIGVELMQRGTAAGWNWSFLGGYPTSADLGQNFGAHLFLPMQIVGARVAFHLLQVIWLFSLPLYVWWDLSREDRRLALLAFGIACVAASAYSGTLLQSGDVNSMAGVFSAGLALVGSRAARLGRRWGGPVMILGLAGGLYSHIGFFAYACLYLTLEAIYFRDRAALLRLIAAAAAAATAALPLHWESLRYPQYVSLNNVAFDPWAPIDWPVVFRQFYYNVEILALPHRWLNDYRSLVNVWMLPILIVACGSPRSRAGFFAWATLLTQGVLRLSAGQFGAGFDRIMHMFPLLAAPALAAFLLRSAGSRALATALAAVIAIYPQTVYRPIPHVDTIREFDPALIDRLASLDGPLVLVEVSPHRDMDSDPVSISPKTPFVSHFESMLPGVAGQRFYSQMYDGWIWSIWRGQVVGAGTYQGRAIDRTPIEAFTAEMRRWGVKHLLVWTPRTRAYLAASPLFAERWHNDRWTDFEFLEPDLRTVVVPHGTGRLVDLDLHGATVELNGVQAGDEVVVRTNYYPAWTARAGTAAVALHERGGQLAFISPGSGDIRVALVYPRRPWLSVLAVVGLLCGVAALSVWPSARKALPRAA